MSCTCDPLQVVMTGVIPHTVPPPWQIGDALLILPFAVLVGGHLLGPLVLNPHLMKFQF